MDHDQGLRIPTCTRDAAINSPLRARQSAMAGTQIDVCRAQADHAWDLAGGDGRILVRQLSLSRLNHRLPRAEAHTEVVQCTAEFHHEIADTLLPQADPVLHKAAALHTAVDMLDPQPPLVERLVGPFLLPCQLLAAGFLGRHEGRHLTPPGVEEGACESIDSLCSGPCQTGALAPFGGHTFSDRPE